MEVKKWRFKNEGNIVLLSITQELWLLGCRFRSCRSYVESAEMETLSQSKFKEENLDNIWIIQNLKCQKK